MDVTQGGPLVRFLHLLHLLRKFRGGVGASRETRAFRDYDFVKKGAAANRSLAPLSASRARISAVVRRGTVLLILPPSDFLHLFSLHLSSRERNRRRFRTIFRRLMGSDV